MARFYPLGLSSDAGFALAMKWLYQVEGYYSDDKDDLGGKTTWGITEQLARRYGYKGDMMSLPKSLAERIYRAEFWDGQRLGGVSEMCYPLAHEAFEATVNQGGYRGVKYLQRALSSARSWGRNSDAYPKLEADGQIGSATIGALRSAVEKMEVVEYLYTSCNMQQYARYLEICEARPVNLKYLRGWYLKRIGSGIGSIIETMP